MHFPFLPRTAVITVIVVLLATIAVGQVIEDSEPALALYAEGKRLVQEGDWFRALQAFKELEGKYPDSKNLDVFIFCRSKAHYYLGEYSEAIAGFSHYVSRFGNSPEIAYAHFFIANSYYRLGAGSRAMTAYLKSYQLSFDDRLDRLLLSSIDAALSNATEINLSPADFQGLPDKKRCPVVRLAADALVDKGMIDMANRLLAMCGEQIDASVFSKATSGQRQTELKIAMVLPFSGELHTWTEDIYNGAVIAANMFRRESGSELTLIPHDTKGDPVEAARIVSELARTKDIDAAVGPLTSEEAAVVSAVLSCESLPLVVPAATQAGLTLLSSTTFQLSPNIELQGTRMAEYAVDSLKADSAAIITSTSPDHLRMSRSFSERFRQLGGKVAGIEYYRSRDKDFGPYIRDLKSILWNMPPDSIYFTNEEGDTLDPDGIPVGIDCLFLPGSPQQLRLLLPQIHFYQLTGNYLGSDGWADETIYRLGDNVTKGAVFPSPFLVGSNSDEDVQFSAAFDSRFGRQPTRLSRVGYDAIRLVIQACDKGCSSREKLVSALEQTKDFAGASGMITFGKNRENIELPLYRIESGKAVVIGENQGIVDSPEGE